MSHSDKTLTCRDGGAEFVFTTGEQEFYAQKGFSNQPAHCPSRKSGEGGWGNKPV